MNGTTGSKGSLSFPIPRGLGEIAAQTYLDGKRVMEQEFNDKLRVVFHWPLYIWGDEATPTYVDCDYCGLTIWLDNTGIYRQELSRPIDDTEPDEQSPHTNLDVLYKAVTLHMPNCEHAPAVSILEKPSESQ